LRKDLARLEEDSAPEDRKRVLARLAQSRWFAQNPRETEPDHAYRRAVRTYISDQQDARSLLLQREGYFYENNELNPEERKAYLTDRAKDGSAEYQLYLGVELYQTAEGRDCCARDWLQRASRGGFVAADLWLGFLYSAIAENAKPADRRKYLRLAHASYRQAASRGALMAKRGDPWAQVMIGRRFPDIEPWLAKMSWRQAETVKCDAASKISRSYRHLMGIGEGECNLTKK
jgi:hypothetical protein